MKGHSTLTCQYRVADSSIFRSGSHFVQRSETCQHNAKIGLILITSINEFFQNPTRYCVMLLISQQRPCYSVFYFMQFPIHKAKKYLFSHKYMYLIIIHNGQISYGKIVNDLKILKLRWNYKTLFNNYGVYYELRHFPIHYLYFFQHWIAKF